MIGIQVRLVRQSVSENALTDVVRALRPSLLQTIRMLPPRKKVAIAVGSRGIAELPSIVSAVVRAVRDRDCAPFIVPAMGSHGGGTAEGQLELLASYGIREENVGAPILSSMEVAQIAKTRLKWMDTDIEFPVFCDRYVLGADAVILINRVKPHTDFTGEFESGLMKMLVIGLGKKRQAEEVHRYGAEGLRVLIPLLAREALNRLPIAFGVAIVENAEGRVARVEAIESSRIPQREKELLAESRRLMPRLPFADLDVLVVMKMGKNISGVGMDPHVVGRRLIRGEPEPERPRVRRLVALDLTDESHGNALGVGLADVITRRLYAKIDFNVTYTNVLTSGFLERGFIPIVADNDRDAISIAVNSCGNGDSARLRLAAIRDTLHVREMLVSEALLQETTDVPLESIGAPLELPFNESAELMWG